MTWNKALRAGEALGSSQMPSRGSGGMGDIGQVGCQSHPWAAPWRMPLPQQLYPSCLSGGICTVCGTEQVSTCWLRCFFGAGRGDTFVNQDESRPFAGEWGAWGCLWANLILLCFSGTHSRAWPRNLALLSCPEGDRMSLVCWGDCSV